MITIVSWYWQGVLTVVDVYSEWAGPCNAMANYLKKIKLDVGDELLQCAMASCDSIEALKMFRGHCKPIWLFIMSGTWRKVTSDIPSNKIFRKYVKILILKITCQ